ncbi:MAG: lytic transglycosylase domain-containing protein [Bacteroidetes bacterium]|nr:MAG: lytic transglycosylase domain-containing protein [Bacteroidota bacterium]
MVFLLASWPRAFPLRLHDPAAVPDQVAAYQLLFDQICLKVVQDSAIYREGWDSLPQPRFWRQAMQLPPDSVMINIAKTRQVVGYMKTMHWVQRSERAKKAFEDSIRSVYDLDRDDEIYFTTGRRHFYHFAEVLPQIDRAVEIFEEEGVDPWYAQAILLIESPGRLQFSTEGAYGAFQLMEGVAREMGLTVNDSIDERAEFDPAARGAARLIRRICLPKTRQLLAQQGLAYRETDTWFRLLVMHVYHAGIGNVRRAVRKVRSEEGGIPFFQELWQTKSRRFGNASQNYSQIILAALMELDQLLQRTGIICDALPEMRDSSAQALPEIPLSEPTLETPPQE